MIKKKKHDEAELQDDAPEQLPANMQIKETDVELRITRKWRSAAVRPLVTFGILWNVMIWFMVVVMLFGGGLPGLPFLLPFIATALGFAYFIACFFLNNTTITVNPVFIHIRHEPLRIGKGVMIQAPEIEHVFMKSRVSMEVNGIPIYIYELFATLKNGKRKRLIGVESETQALYLERQIERFLDLEETGKEKHGQLA